MVEGEVVGEFLEMLGLWGTACHMPPCTAVQTSPTPHMERTARAHVPDGFLE